MVRFRREKHLLTVFIVREPDGHYATLLEPDQILLMFLTNLRNRPLSNSNIDSMAESMLSLYHGFVTGSTEFPSIQCEKSFVSALITTPFCKSERSQIENTKPSRLILKPAAMVVPPGAPRCSPSILTPVHPEKIELGALKADRRNHVLNVQYDGSSVTRVISGIYRADGTELTNRWRVTDYSTDGHILMSVLCRFTGTTAQSAKTQSVGKRKDREDKSSSSSMSPLGKRLRL